MNLTITELLAAITDLKAVAHQYRMYVQGHFHGCYGPAEREHITTMLELENLEPQTVSQGPQGFWEFTVMVNGRAVLV